MTKSVLSPHGSSDLPVSVSTSQRHIFMTLPQLIVDRANLPMTAKHLAGRLSRAGHLFERGLYVVDDAHDGG